MKRLERLTALLSFLQSRRYAGVRELEEKFGVSERTIYRDLRSLDESGVPISFEKDKGYFIVDKYFLPPLAFTLDEAKSFIFMERLAEKYTDKEVFGHFSSALEKIKNKLKHYQLEDIELLESNIGTYIDSNYTPKYIHLTEQAISNKKVLNISYKDIRGNRTERTVEPIGMTFYSQTWHLIAYCRLREDYRDFALSRITAISLSNEYITEKRLSLSEYIKKLEEAEQD
ncbi:WYL domain-containing protein [Leptobacterium flavescens]|uniref:WYL domain-containing protein n=1 Tax=Leptobacterium flavescens TaxID=472055 RepID=A0A6P0UFH4_9FLAO|nr:YafY family protein [Leptobacterium flavescens]NER12031.1 WYL domain-containing protein [Leptobacterium flavescens]